MKSTTISRTIQSDSTFQEDDVLQFNIHNYGDEPCIMIWNNTRRPIPAIGSDGVPYSFHMTDYGNEFHLEIGFEFLNGIGNVIVDFTKKQSC